MNSKSTFSRYGLKTIIHRNVRLGESPSFGETIVIHDATSRAINYLNFEELLKKLEVTV